MINTTTDILIQNDQSETTYQVSVKNDSEFIKACKMAALLECDNKEELVKELNEAKWEFLGNPLDTLGAWCTVQAIIDPREVVYFNVMYPKTLIL